MTRKWFTDCVTAEQVKQRYHELVKRFHPDNGGDGKVLVQIIAEFKAIWNSVKDVHFNKAGEKYTSARPTTESPDEFIDILENLGAIPGIKVELCGSWLWLDGSDLFAYREYLKEIGCRWSKSKSKWYWTHDPYIPKRKRVYSMEAIRQMFGSEELKTKERMRVQG